MGTAIGAAHPGDGAQLGERGVRNAEVGGAMLFVSILFTEHYRHQA